MKDEITINLRALTQKEIDAITKILDETLNIIEDETNAEALEILNEYEE